MQNKKKIEIGIIGVGYWGPNLVRTFSSIDNVQVKYVADKSNDRLDFIKTEFPTINTVNDFNIILNDKAISIIVIVTPMETHYEIAKKSLESGKHIFVEKPFTVKSNDASELIKLAKKNNLKIGVGHLFTFHPGIETIKNFIISSNLDTYYINFNRANLRPPTAKYNVIWDLAVHDIAVANYLLDQFPIKVGSSSFDYSGRGLEDMAIIQLEYGSNKFVNIHVGWHTPNKIRNFQLYGDKNSIFFNDLGDPRLQIFDEGIDNREDYQNGLNKELSYGVGEIICPNIPDTQPLYNECNAFINYISNGGHYKNDGESGYWVVKTIEEIITRINK